jgi:hypothetical protein
MGITQYSASFGCAHVVRITRVSRVSQCEGQRRSSGRVRLVLEYSMCACGSSTTSNASILCAYGSSNASVSDACVRVMSVRFSVVRVWEIAVV